uniref:Uncharacterized protein n=1 Tax=Zea mays TaxID=4577 RepID=B7ZZB9_MAIZE|nr:unknown [Zea mays]ACR37067.1 unknown [Zea mays]
MYSVILSGALTLHMIYPPVLGLLAATDIHHPNFCLT